MTLTAREEEKLQVFERKTIRIVMGTKMIEDNEYRNLMNHEKNHIEDDMSNEYYGAE